MENRRKTVDGEAASATAFLRELGESEWVAKSNWEK
jgi:hypothetical protein